MKRVMCVWFPHWPLQATLVKRPEWKEHPVVLYTTGGRSGFTVLSRSQKAAAQGVKPGMPLAQARALLDGAAPAPKYQAFESLAYRLALKNVAVWCQQFSPFVGPEEAELPESLFLDITGCDHMFGGEAAMADTTASELASRGFVAHVAIADTLGAAWAVAHYGKQAVSVIPVSRQAEALQVLPIEALRIAPAAADKLRQLDIRAVHQLQSLPRKSLPSRFGDTVVHRLDQALGKQPELIQTIPPPLSFEAKHTFDLPTTNRRWLETVICKLVEQIVAATIEANKGILQLTCRLHQKRGRESFSAQITVRMLQPTVSTQWLLELIRLQLDATKLSSDVGSVHAKAVVAPFEVCQLWLFGDSDQHRRRKELMFLIERLSSRLGPQAIVQPGWTRNPQPEFAVSYASALERFSSKKRSGIRQNSDAGRNRNSGEFRYDYAKRKKTITKEQPSRIPSVTRFRPTSLTHEPVPISVMSVVPDGPPLRFFWQGRTHTVAHSWGPERIETGWWRGKHERRDYYRVETRAGARFWLFRRMTDGKWFLHGFFE